MASRSETDKTAEAQPAAVFARYLVMKNRADFVATSKAKYKTATGLTFDMMFVF